MVTLRSITVRVEVEVKQPIFLKVPKGLIVAFAYSVLTYYGPDTVLSKLLVEIHLTASAVL